MPKPGRVLRRVRDSDVPGVNWRPTLFAEEFLHPHACCLCQVIPRNTILLPCTHALCDTCERGSLRRNGTGGTCPLCGENFEEDECQGIKISPKKASNLKAYCWNHAHGCRFVDVLPAVLQHYEQDCSYHSTPCLSCGESVPQRDLPKHYRSGCRRRRHSGKGNRHSGPGDGGSGDWSFLVASGEPNLGIDDALLSALQSQMNDLARQMSEIGQALEKATGMLTDAELGLDSELSEALETLSVASGESADSEKRVHLASQSSTVSSGSYGAATEQTGAQTSAEADTKADTKAEAKPEAKAQPKAGKTVTMPWVLEQRHILRKLEIVANHVIHYLEGLHMGAPAQVNTSCELLPLGSHDTIDAQLSLIARRYRMQRHVTYRFVCKTTDGLLKIGVSNLTLIGAATRWYRRVLFFTVILAVRSSEHNLEVFVKWGRTLDADRRLPLVTTVALVHDKLRKTRALKKVGNLPADALFLPGYHERFKISYADLKDLEEFIQNGQLNIEVVIGDQPAPEPPSL